MGILLAVIAHIPLLIGFMPGFLFLVHLVKSRDVPLRQITKICMKGIKRTSTVITILFLVSFLLPSWFISGTIDELVSISLHVITPQHFVVLSFIIALIFSMILGTSVGTLSSIGIPIISTAMSIGIPLEMVAGALISGAFVGDRTSPFSSAHQLLSHTLEIPVKRQFKSMMLTTVLAVGACLIIYAFLDLRINVSDLPPSQDSFNWSELSLVKFLPPISLILLVLFRIKIVYAFICSIIAASSIAFLEKVSIGNLLSSYFYGIEGIGGGVSNMYLLLLFLALAGAYNGLLEEYKVIQPFLNSWLNSSSNLLGDTWKTIIATFGITLISANQTLPIILTGRSFLNHWSTKHTTGQLARVMGDSTMLFPGMIPWSVLAIMCSTIVGVPFLEYLPYAVFLWILPVLTVLSSIAGNSRSQKLRKVSKAS
ncbi:Na+/H+ antiporter NhaC family protein [Cytobacillus sp. FJAT-54145]|uniref:Na+/H+ antiporter NhaC family protein n=1 Tax=Cytobacillus spartinae TaxID=3299023 RepID=A0ABW6KAB4_9BACI